MFIGQEPPDPHDPDHVIIPALLTACPSFADAWTTHTAVWPEADGREVYIDLGEFASHMVALLERGVTAEFIDVFATVERLLCDGDPGVRYAVTVGLLEDLGNVASHQGSPFAARFREWFGPLTAAAWDELHTLWGTSDISQPPSQPPHVTKHGAFYEVTVENGQDWITLVDPRGYPVLDDLAKVSQDLVSEPLVAKELMKDDFGRRTRRTDFPHLASNVLVMSERAASVLSPLIDSCGTTLPWRVGDRQLTLFQPVTVDRLLDEDASEIARFSDGRIMNIRKYRFTDEIPTCHVFRLKQAPQGPILVSDAFVAKAREGGLIGPAVRGLSA